MSIAVSISVLLWTLRALIAFPANEIHSGVVRGRQTIPPDPVHKGYFKDSFPSEEIAKKLSSWKQTDEENPWEISGQYEGDIMLYGNAHKIDMDPKNGLLDEKFRWPKGIVPYHIEEDEFSEKEIKEIVKAMQEYKNRTCIQFRKYRKTDEDWIVFQSNQAGCWSAVGRKSGGQVINLQIPGCAHKGVVIHEILHALGFYHEQSTSNRDEYVKIHWENIIAGKEHNFNKYNSSVVTDYSAGYDYGSIMHYSAKAFSKDGSVTIEPLKSGAKIGQRDELSEKDIFKLEKMYEKECAARQSEETDEDVDNSLFSYFFE